jgi:DNA repair exonuclease SbcCD nuclease subunit
VPDWPKNVTIFDSEGASVLLRRAGRHLATIHGVSHPVRDVAKQLRRIFRPEDPSGLHIGMLHGAVGGEEEAGSGPNVALDELCGLPVRYWALGHEPSRRYVSQDPWIVYPGTLQGRAATSDGDASGALVVEVANGAVRQVSFEALDVVRFRSVEIEDAERLERTDLLRQALDRGQALRRENSGRALLLEVRLHTRTGLVDELNAWLVSELRTRTEDWDPFVWWTVSDDRSTGEPLRNTALRRSEIASLVLDRSEALLGAALPRSSFLAHQLEPLQQALEAELDLDEAKALMREATSLAIEELTEKPIE